MEYKTQPIAQLRKEAIDRGVNEKDVTDKRKAELIEMLEKLDYENTGLRDLVEPEPEALPLADIEEDDRPAMYSDEWSAFLISKLTEKEKEGDNPKVDGLRRLCHNYFGDIISCLVRCIQAPTEENGNNAVAECLIKVCGHQDGVIREYSDVADCSWRNTEAKFARFATATASTRAEGRVLRKLLGIHAVTAEEITTIPVELEQEDEDVSITETQINGLNRICKKANIDVVKFINSGSRQYGSVYNVSKSTAIKMLAQLNEYYNGHKQVPVEILGYVENWRD